MSQDGAGGRTSTGGQSSGAGGGSSREYKCELKISWGGHVYPLKSAMDSDKNVSVWLKQLRNIVCRCQVGRFANEQLRVPALLTGTVLGRHAVRDSTTFGSVETPTMVGTKAMVSIVATCSARRMEKVRCEHPAAEVFFSQAQGESAEKE